MKKTLQNKNSPVTVSDSAELKENKRVSINESQ